MSTLTISRARGSAAAKTVPFVGSDARARLAVAEYLRRCGYAVIEALPKAYHPHRLARKSKRILEQRRPRG